MFGFLIIYLKKTRLSLNSASFCPNCVGKILKDNTCLTLWCNIYIKILFWLLHTFLWKWVTYTDLGRALPFFSGQNKLLCFMSVFFYCLRCDKTTNKELLVVIRFKMTAISPNNQETIVTLPLHDQRSERDANLVGRKPRSNLIRDTFLVVRIWLSNIWDNSNQNKNVTWK